VLSMRVNVTRGFYGGNLEVRFENNPLHSLASFNRTPRKHLYGDLRPYCCTVKDCPNPQINHGSTRQWVVHEKQHLNFDWRRQERTCPFCAPSLQRFTGEAYFKHVSKHLREVSLAALPRTTMGENDSSVESGSSSSIESEHGSLPPILAEHDAGALRDSTHNGKEGNNQGVSRAGGIAGALASGLKSLQAMTSSAGMLSERQKEPLHRQLEDGALHCGMADDLPSKFLPERLIHEIVTKDNIKATLPRRLWIPSQFSPTGSIVDRIHDQAKKVFAILTLIGQEHTISDLIYKDNITDKDLPLFPGSPGKSILCSLGLRGGDTAKEFPSFASWDEWRVRDFLEKQWLVLAPILDVTGKELNLDPRCPLPFTEIELRAWSRGTFIHKASLHPAHQLWSDEVGSRPLAPNPNKQEYH
jgi:hypothetical protein